MTIKKKKEISRKTEEFISKGGKVLGDNITKDTLSVTLKFPRVLLERLDANLKNKPGIPRSVWIYEAVYARLEKEENQN